MYLSTSTGAPAIESQMVPTKPPAKPPPSDSPRKGAHITADHTSPDRIVRRKPKENPVKAQDKRLSIISYLPLHVRYERINTEIDALCTVQAALEMDLLRTQLIEEIKHLEHEKLSLYANTRQYDIDKRQEFAELNVQLKAKEKQLKRATNQEWHARKDHEETLRQHLKKIEALLKEAASSTEDVNIDSIKAYHAEIKSTKLQLRSGIYGSDKHNDKHAKEVERIEKLQAQLSKARSDVDEMKKQVRKFDLHRSNLNKAEEQTNLRVQEIHSEINKKREMLDEIDLRAGIVMELLRLITQLIEDSNKQMGELAIEINCDYIKLEQLDRIKKAMKEKRDILSKRPEFKRKEVEEKRQREEEAKAYRKFPGKLHLIESAKQGDFDATQVFVRRCSGKGKKRISAVNVQDENGNSPLIYAVINGHVEIAEFLCDEEADIEACNKDGWNPMHMAAIHGKSEIIVFLAQRGADINAINGLNGSTALHQAILNLRIGVIKVLLKHDALHDISDKTGMTAMDAAVQRGSNECIDLMQRAHALPRTRKQYPGLHGLINAVENSDIEAVQTLLLSSEINIGTIDDDGKTALHKSCEKGLKDIASILCNNRADVNAKERWDGNTPLHFAAMNGWLEISKNLVDLFKANIDAQNDSGWSALHFACENGHVDIVEALSMRGSDVSLINDNGYTALHKAVQFGHTGIVDILCKEDKVRNIIDSRLKDGSTALCLAASKGYGSIIRILLNNRANRSLRNNYHQTPLDIAMRYTDDGHLRCVDILEHTKMMH